MCKSQRPACNSIMCEQVVPVKFQDQEAIPAYFVSFAQEIRNEIRALGERLDNRLRGQDERIEKIEALCMRMQNDIMRMQNDMMRMQNDIDGIHEKMRSN